MKGLLTTFALLSSAGLLQAQWTNVGAGLGDLNVRAMFTYVDTLMVGTADGIFRSENLGGAWTDVSGDIGSRNINDIRGGGAPRAIWAATSDGAWFTFDQADYMDISTGLTNRNASYYWFGDDGVDEHDWAIGTLGGGVFTSDDLQGPWVSTSVGLSGGGLMIRDFSGYDDDEVNYAVLATDDGLYFSEDEMGTWEARNTGLSGDALLVKRVLALGSGTLAATLGGLYLGMELGSTYVPLIPGERVRTFHFGSPIGLLAFGEGGYFTSNFLEYTPIDMSGVQGGDVTCVAVSTEYVFIGTESGGVYRRPLGQFTAIDEPVVAASAHRLLPNAPNPFNPTTTIGYALTRPGQVELTVHDLAGRAVRTLIDTPQPAGGHQLVFDATGLPSGIYFARLSVDGQPIATQRMLLMK